MTARDVPTATYSGRFPVGRVGQLLAILILLLLLVLCWSAVVQPLLAWHMDRDAALETRRMFANRAEVLAASLPALRAERERIATASSGTIPVLEGATDAVAGAALQQIVGDMARRLGINLSSAELLPAEAAGTYRRVRLRVTLQAPWSAIIALLEASVTASPGMVIDDLQIRAAPNLFGTTEPSLDASWTVLAFRAALP